MNKIWENKTYPSVAASQDALAKCKLEAACDACCEVWWWCIWWWWWIDCCWAEECCNRLSCSTDGIGKLKSWNVSFRDDTVLHVRHCTELTRTPSNMSEIMLRYCTVFFLFMELLDDVFNVLPPPHGTDDWDPAVNMKNKLNFKNNLIFGIYLCFSNMYLTLKW